MFLLSFTFSSMTKLTQSMIPWKGQKSRMTTRTIFEWSLASRTNMLSVLSTVYFSLSLSSITSSGQSGKGLSFRVLGCFAADRCLSHILYMVVFSQRAFSAGGYGVESFSRQCCGRLTGDGFSVLSPNPSTNFFLLLRRLSEPFFRALIASANIGGV